MTSFRKMLVCSVALAAAAAASGLAEARTRVLWNDNGYAVMVEAHGHKANVHLAIEDATGNSAIIEFIGGKPVIHHGRQHRVMTNDSTYAQQLALLEKHDFSKPASDMPLPGNVNTGDRFQRATYDQRLLPKPKSEREAAASILVIARNVSVPFGAPTRGSASTTPSIAPPQTSPRSATISS